MVDLLQGVAVSSWYTTGEQRGLTEPHVELSSCGRNRRCDLVSLLFQTSRCSHRMDGKIRVWHESLG